MDKSECDICYETEHKLINLTCCKGKKWCKDCQNKVPDKGPFCRTQFKKEFNFIPFEPYNGSSTIPEDGVHMYSFSLNPEVYQPSGSVNMSMIETAINYGILNILSDGFQYTD
jgi:hypothetical protein